MEQGQSVTEYFELLVQVFELVLQIPNTQLLVVSVLPRPGAKNKQKTRYIPYLMIHNQEFTTLYVNVIKSGLWLLFSYA